MNSEPIILYIHIPKAGGTTLADLIYGQLRASARDSGESEEDGWLNSKVFHYPSGYVRGPYRHDMDRIRRVLPRHDLKAVLGHFLFGIHQSLTRPASYVTMLRHPVQRALSLYHFEKIVEANFGDHQGIRMPADTTLEAFMEEPPFKDVDNGQVRRISGCWPEIGGCTRAMLNRAKENLRRHFAVVGITEHFDETLLLLRHVFSWDDDIFYYPKNTNPDRAAMPHLQQETFDAILEHNALDYELYQFAGELMKLQILWYGAAFQEKLEGYRLKKQAWYNKVASEGTRA
jgi:hypothetical protein